MSRGSPGAGSEGPAAGRDPVPVRVGAADVGSNAIRFVIAETGARDGWRVVDSVREAVRLGHEAFRSGHLDREAIGATASAFAAFRSRVEDLRVTRVRAVATSAARESRNGRELVDAVRRASGMELEIIDPAEEARLVWTAVRARIHPSGHPSVIVDLGGGSVEVSVADEGGIRWSESHPLGAVRLLAELGAADDPCRRLRARLDDYAEALSRAEPFTGGSPKRVVGIGGNIEALAKLCGARRDDRGVSEVELAALEAVADALSRLSPAERAEEHGLAEDRADVIVPAARVYARTVRVAGGQGILVPHVGLREGLLRDLLKGPPSPR